MTISSINKKRLVIRLVLLGLIVLLGFGLFYIGKEHEVLLDNKTASIEGRDYAAVAYMEVIVDGDEEKSVEFYADDRDVVKVRGPKHSIKVIVKDEQSDEVLASVERSFNFGTEAILMVSLPALVGKAENVYLPLPDIHADALEEEEEEVVLADPAEITETTEEAVTEAETEQ